MPGIRVSKDQLQIILHRYYFASKFVSAKEVLEIGVGPGIGLGYLSRNAKMVVGGDVTTESLRYAQQRCKGKSELVSLDAHKLPFIDSCFDVIVVMATIIYLHLPNFFNECHRVLKEGGILVFNTPNRSLPNFNPSCLSKNYFSAPELFTILSQYHFDTKLFGAFPLLKKSGSSVLQNFIGALIASGRKIFKIVPKGEIVRKFLSSTIYDSNLILNNEIDGELVDRVQVKNIQLVPISHDFPDFQHRILYGVAYAQKI